MKILHDKVSLGLSYCTEQLQGRSANKLISQPCQQKQQKHRKPLKVWPQLQKQNVSTWDHRGTGCRLLIATQNQPAWIAGKNGSVRELHWAFWSAPPLNYSDKPAPASLKTSLPPWSCVLLWMNCFLFHFVSIFLQKLTLLYCSSEWNCCLAQHYGLSLFSSWQKRTAQFKKGDTGVASLKN